MVVCGGDTHPSPSLSFPATTFSVQSFWGLFAVSRRTLPLPRSPCTPFPFPLDLGILIFTSLKKEKYIKRKKGVSKQYKKNDSGISRISTTDDVVYILSAAYVMQPLHVPSRDEKCRGHSRQKFNNINLTMYRPIVNLP